MSGAQGASARQIHEDAARRRKALDAELALTRGRATSWAKGIGALLAAGLTFSLVKGRSELTDLAPGFAVAVGVLLIAAIAVATVAVYFLLSAAYGRLGDVPPETTDHTLAVQTMDDLRSGLRWAVLGVVVLLLSVGVTWFGPAADGPSLQVVHAGGTSWCGEPIRTDGGILTLEVDGQEVQLDLAEVAQLLPLASCPKP